MNLLDLAAFAATALWRHRLRTGLSLLGIAIGVAAVVTLTSLGEGARRYVMGEFAFLGSDLVIVVPGKNETTGVYPGVGGVPNDLTVRDARAIRTRIPEVREVAPVAIGLESVSFRERSRDVTLLGTVAEMQSARDLVMSEGRFLPTGDWERGTTTAVLGHRLAAELFPGTSPVGQTVRIADWRMRVIGVLEPQGVHLGIDMDEVAVVPVATALRMFNRTSLFRIMVRLHPRADLEVASDRILALIEERHDEDDVTVLTPDALATAVGDIVTALSVALAGIAAVSLSVAGLGVMNVMLVSVAERTAEIGLLRAVGVSRRQILGVFLAESVMLTVLGGLVGLGTSLGLVHGLRLVLPVLPAATPGWAIAAALLVSGAVGVCFGVMPARSAARLDPVTALSGSMG